MSTLLHNQLTKETSKRPLFFLIELRRVKFFHTPLNFFIGVLTPPFKTHLNSSTNYLYYEIDQIINLSNLSTKLSFSTFSLFVTVKMIYYKSHLLVCLLFLVVLMIFLFTPCILSLLPFYLSPLFVLLVLLSFLKSLCVCL